MDFIIMLLDSFHLNYFYFHFLEIRWPLQSFRNANVFHMPSCYIQQELCRVHGYLRHNTQGRKIIHGLPGVTMVYGLALSDQQKFVKHVKDSARWLVDRRDDCSTCL